jgi:hypothetical protein
MISLPASYNLTAPLLPLFVYGTLRDPDLLASVLGRPLRPGRIHMAVAPGFRAVHYPDRIYPALIRTAGARAEGLLLTDLSSFERDLLDGFEGEEYVRGPVAVMIEEELFEADAYLPAIAVPQTAEDWSLPRWQQTHKPSVLAADATTAREIRERLISTRPH